MLDAVLPLTLADHARFEILDRSIRMYFESLNVLWIVVIDSEYNELKRLVTNRRYRLVTEGSIAPEMTQFPHIIGWHRQQLLKLAAAALVETPFYLTLDADVFLTRPLRTADLIKDGKALCHRYKELIHADWYAWAERVLGVERSGWVHGVTPALLSVRGVKHLAAFVNRRSPRSSIFGWWPRDRLGNSRWRKALLENMPWTEYALYFTCLEASGLFERWYNATYTSLYGNCFWAGTQYEFQEWDWRKSFDPEATHYFTVLQSAARIPVNDVWSKLEGSPLQR